MREDECGGRSVDVEVVILDRGADEAGERDAPHRPRGRVCWFGIGEPFARHLDHGDSVIGAISQISLISGDTILAWTAATTAAPAHGQAVAACRAARA